ncbi:hypothetical protein [Listeria immobilis]|nr:hypothetical protein [Listeria immobilis]MBC6312018.1 hypothetical protein [Listeria immobilis]
MQPTRYKAKMRKQATREATRNSLLRQYEIVSKEKILETVKKAIDLRF